jgi:hypothetical protein
LSAYTTHAGIPGHLVHVRAGWQPGTGVDELAYPLPGDVTDRTGDEGPVGSSHGGDFGELLQDPFGGLPVGLVVILRASMDRP